MIVFRHADPRVPFLWEARAQPPARWHAADEGPANYFSDTPDGAWAEFLRHEDIRDPDDLTMIRRTIWAVEIGDERAATPALSQDMMTGGLETHVACRAEAARLRARGANRLVAPAAALQPDAARGSRVDGGLVPGPPRGAQTIVLFGRRPDLIGWRATYVGRPADDLLPRVRHFT